MFCLCFAFDIGYFQIIENELVTTKIRFPPAPLINSLEENDYILQIE